MSWFGGKKTSHHRTWIFIGLVLTLVAVIKFGVRSANERPERASNSYVQSNLPEQSIVKTQKNSASEHNVSDAAVKFDTPDYAQCEQFIQEFHSESFSWSRKYHRDWASYLEQGYSLDEITLAVERFANSNFAASFRVKQLRKGTEFAFSNQQLNEQLRQQFPELADSGLSIELKVPLTALASFATMTDEEKRQVLAEHQVGVNDVAYFINSGLSDEDILMMLSDITIPAAIVSYEGIEAISLLDFAVAASRPVLVENLLLMGLSPTSDAYLGSSMEWALSRLTFANENTEANAVEVVKLLKLHGAQARFKVKRPETIEGSSPRHFYSFSEEKIVSLSQNYQLDLTQIEQREVPALDGQHPLIDTLEAERDVYLAAKLGNPNHRELQGSCQRILHAVDKQWQPKSAHEVVNSIEKLYGESATRIISELARIDPLLVDIYRERRDRPIAGVRIPPEAIKQVQQGDIKQAMSYLEGHSYSDNEKRMLIIQLLGFNVEYFSELNQSSLWVDDLQFFDLMLLQPNVALVQALEQAGANLRGVDSREKTLMYYATERFNVSLVSFLQSEGYPFSFDDQGQDPLHVVLRSNQSGVSRQDIETLVNVLMAYHPDIDAFHRSRMAVIQLKYPRLYESLISRHPELAITGDTPLPYVR
ncbi:hypothetical protein SAMN06297280_2875 [Arsukibacterium tuosuense]|uniref:Uncharacterized protein n=1 Tax=Arsukibacterium tuosuense TaxID=1323745 RepID=A0A285J5H8_9GAMM|nr:ankyrin repeat domain-containing protein [Arsukibacterium tuosuense]SNY55462.1 hypothetical protein SAMN06297280_2875 [Arsukibacterium tuosuense]